MPPEEEFWSPYTGLDALCGNTLLIALDALVEAGFLDKADLPPKRPVADADFAHVCACSACLCACILVRPASALEERMPAR